MQLPVASWIGEDEDAPLLAAALAAPAEGCAVVSLSETAEAGLRAAAFCSGQ